MATRVVFSSKVKISGIQGWLRELWVPDLQYRTRLKGSKKVSLAPAPEVKDELTSRHEQEDSHKRESSQKKESATISIDGEES